MTIPDETTSGKAEAMRALRESQKASNRTDQLVADLRKDIAVVRESRERNHFRDKLVAIIRGAAA